MWHENNIKKRFVFNSTHISHISMTPLMTAFRFNMDSSPYDHNGKQMKYMKYILYETQEAASLVSQPKENAWSIGTSAWRTKIRRSNAGMCCSVKTTLRLMTEIRWSLYPTRSYVVTLYDPVFHHSFSSLS